MHHTIAWRVSAADATETDVTPVPDSIMLVQNAHFVPQYDYALLWAYFGAATPSRARFIAPSFRQITTPWLRPINPAIVPGDEVNVVDYRDNPLRIRALEELQFAATQSSGGAAVVAGVAAISKTPYVAAPKGDIYTMRGTGATTVTAGAWSLVTVTWQDTLPAGLYACVGCEFQGTTCIAGRLVFEDQVERPGGLGQSALSGNGGPIFRKGGTGVWGKFNANRMPNVEYLCNAADTAQELYLDLIKIG